MESNKSNSHSLDETSPLIMVESGGDYGDTDTNEGGGEGNVSCFFV
jgi:hypothetical protein